MAVDVSQIDLEHDSFNEALDEIINQRDNANDELNDILDPIVEDLGGDPAHLRFASKKVNYILENENEWALTETLGKVEFNYNKRLNVINDLARNAEKQVIIKQKALAENDKIISNCSQEITNIQNENEKLKRKNAGIEAKKDELEDKLKKLEVRITELQQLEENPNIKRGLNQETPLGIALKQKENYENQIADLVGQLAENNQSIISDTELNNLIARRDEYLKKQAQEYDNLEEQKTNLINEFKKDKITLNFSDSVPAEQGENENTEQTKPEEAQKAKAGGVAGAGAPVQASGMIEDDRTPEQLVKDMYKRLTEDGKIDAQSRKRLLSGIGYSDLIDMASRLSTNQRRNVQVLLNATLKDLGRLDNEQAEEVDEFLRNKFGVSDAYSILAEGDFAKLSEEELSNIKSIIDTFNQNPDNYTRDEQIMIDEFAKRVSLKALDYHMGKAGVVGRLLENFSPESQSRKDILASFNTFSELKSKRVKKVAESSFATNLKANVRSDTEISMDSRDSITTKQKQRSMGLRR